MCTRTKTSYGCGHHAKTTVSCESPTHDCIDRWHYVKDGDCPRCKKEGTSGTRGADGMGRYAKQIQRERRKNHSYPSAKGNSPDDFLEDTSPIRTSNTPHHSGSSSPWLPSEKREKIWQTSHRKQADKAWLSEHKSRISDLQDRLEQCSLSQREEYRSSSPARVFDEPEVYECDEVDDQADRVHHSTPVKYQVEIRKRLYDGSNPRSRSSSHHHEQRQYSHDSLPDSMQSYSSSPRLKSYAVTPHTPINSHEYDYYSSNYSPPKHFSRNCITRAETEPYFAPRTHHNSGKQRQPAMDNFYGNGNGSKYYDNTDYRSSLNDSRVQPFVQYRPTYEC